MSARTRACRWTFLSAIAIGVVGVGLGSAAAGTASDDPPGPPPNTNYCTPHPGGRPPTEPARPAAALAASARNVVLKVGQSATVALRAVQPAQELDTFFLEDNGTKSEFTHCAVQGGILWATSKLTHERNLRVGLGNFGDYMGYGQKDSTGGAIIGPSFGQVYFLDSPIRRPDSTFFTDVKDLGNPWEGGWHAPNGDQADLEALYQAATGAGRVLTALNPDNIPAGESAGFHDGAFRVAVVLTAHWFQTASRTVGYPGPSFATVEAALRERGVNVAGVWMDNSRNKETNSGEPYNGLTDLQTLISDTGTRTSAPLECGEARPKQDAGGLPLCVFVPPADMNTPTGGSGAPYQLGPMLHNLVTSLANPQRVSVQVVAGDKVVAGVTGGERHHVDILLPHVFDAAVTVRCTARMAGRTTPVQLVESVAGRPVASTAFPVTCRKPPKHRPAPPPLAGPVIVTFGPPDLPAKALTVTHAPPNPAPGPQVQTQPLSQGANAIAAGFSEQPDLVAEVASTSERSPDGRSVWFGLMAMSALGMAAVRWQTSSCLARAFGRTHPRR